MKIVVIDTETTGLVDLKSSSWEKQPGIVQLGAMSWIDFGDASSEVKTFEMLVNPEISVWDEGAIKAHGKKPEDVAGAPSFFSANMALAAFIQGADYWAGYNVKFDKAVIWHQLLRYGFEKLFPWPPKEIEVMDLVSAKLGRVPGKGHDKWKLGNAFKAVTGQDPANEHDALGDVQMTADLLRRLWHQ
jgi:DNA polymerase III epsilon subunit-like protein